MKVGFTPEQSVRQFTDFIGNVDAIKQEGQGPGCSVVVQFQIDPPKTGLLT